MNHTSDTEEESGLDNGQNVINLHPSAETFEDIWDMTVNDEDNANVPARNVQCFVNINFNFHFFS